MAGPVPDPAWVPDVDTVARANLTALMERQSIATYDELHRWSCDDPDGFWSAVIDELDIRFVTPPVSVRGTGDLRHPDWLPGASYNIADSCLLGDDGGAAIRYASSEGTSTVTRAALRSRVAAFAEGFKMAGHRRGDRVAIAMPMTVEAVVAYLGTIAAGGVVVSIADSFAPEEIAVRLAVTRPVAIVTQDVTRRLGRELPMYEKCVAASAIGCIVVETGAAITRRPQDVSFDAFTVEGAEYASVPLPAGAHINILFSSGTTGEPKAIPWTQTTPLKAAMDGRYHHDIHAGDVVAWPTNLGWMMGPWLIFASLLNRASMALFPDAPTTRAFIEFVAAAHVTMLGLVPSIVGSWRSAGALSPGDWTEVRVLSSTGEASDPADYRWLMDVAGGVPVIEYCGGTEIGGGYIAGTVLQPATPSRFTTPALGLDLVLLDDDGVVTDQGEVFLVPPSIGLSTELLNRDHDDVYYGDLPASVMPLRRHGDQLVREPGGTYRALGRVDDTMNLGGIKISSAEIEEVVCAVDGVVEAAAVAVPPDGGGPERLVVFAVTDGSGEPESLRAAMQAAVSGHLNPLFRIHEVVLVDALPRTASQKVMRRVLRAGYPST